VLLLLTILSITFSDCKTPQQQQPSAITIKKRLRKCSRILKLTVFYRISIIQKVFISIDLTNKFTHPITNNMQIKKQILALLCTAMSLYLPAQTYNPASQAAYEDTASIVLRAIVISDTETRLRWAPADYATWKMGNEHGYRVSRFTLETGGTPLNHEQYIQSQVDFGVFQVNSSSLEALSQTNETAGLAAGCLFGDSLDILPAGGATLSNVYSKSKEAGTRFGWSLFAADQDFDVATAMALGYKDVINPQSGAAAYTTGGFYSNKFVYFVTIHRDDVFQNKGFFEISAQKDAVVALPKPENLSYIPQDKGVLLQWSPAVSDYTSFDIERSEDSGASFKKVNKSPVLFLNTGVSTPGVPDQASFRDSLADNTSTYIYRVIGRSPFGEQGPVSDTLHVKGQPSRLAFQWHIDQVTETEQSVGIVWTFPTQLEGNMDGFEVWRGKDTEGPFVKINAEFLDKSTRSYVDNNPLPSNYYVIKTNDTNGYKYQTFSRLGQPKDNTPPAPPAIVQGSCTRSGMVSLTWRKSSSSDAMGYRVFFSNVQSGDYQQITSVWVKDTFFTHQISLETLTEEIYFGVKAIDHRENQSEMSAPVTVLRPDIVPPSPPIITSHKATLTGIEFNFELSSSHDVVEYRFERKQSGIPGWVQMTSFLATAPQKYYVDNTGNKRKWYEYRLLAIDDAALQSSSEIVKIKKIDDGLRAPIQNFAGQQAGAEKVIQLSWNYTKDPDLIGFEVYRAIQDSNKQRSYAFVPFPKTVPSANPGYSHAVSTSGNAMHVEFADYDVDLKNIPQINTFQYFPVTDVLTANQAIPPTPVNTANGGTYTISNPNNLAGQATISSVRFYYWVVARYADGASSLIAGAVKVQI
jgi:fibronectin type 3 domain-containing protein